MSYYEHLLQLANFCDCRKWWSANPRYSKLSKGCGTPRLGLDSHSHDHSQVQHGGPVDTIKIASRGVAWRVLCKLSQNICHPVLLTVDFSFTAGRFDLFRSNVPGKSDGSQVTWTPLTTTCMYHPALLLMPSCVFTRAFKSLVIDFLLTVVFVKFTSSCIKKMGLTKYWDFACLGVCIHIVCMIFL